MAPIFIDPREKFGPWFWRGTQSAIFYYLACSPCADYNHKRKRRKEAEKSRKQWTELVSQQPESEPQPVFGQTNKYWTEEINAGPGPPKGWRRDSIAQIDLKRPPTAASNNSKYIKPAETNNGKQSIERFSSPPTSSTTSDSPEPPKSSRPTLEHRSTFDQMREKVRHSLSVNTEGWNLRRYDREDELLTGLNDTMSRMWDRATAVTRRPSGDHKRTRSLSRTRKRADTVESDSYDYYKARAAEINDLHPPIASQLDTNLERVAWMKLPAPSRGVMEGKIKPADEKYRARKPLCRIGGNNVETMRVEKS